MKWILTSIVAVSLVSGCASWQLKESDPKEVAAAAKPALALPKAWVAIIDASPIAHEGSAEALKLWWSKANDPVLLALIQRAQEISPQLEQAKARIAGARAALQIAGSTQLPSVDGRASLTRSSGISPVSTTAIGAVDANWELDLFGGTRANRLVAEQRLRARHADWHDLRVSLAAEVAMIYVSYRACEAQLALLEQDSQSKQQTLALTELRSKAGFQAPADIALSRASISLAQERLIATKAECEVLVKSLSAVTTSDELALRAQLDTRKGQLPAFAAFKVTSVPADAMLQRPDLAALGNELAAAYAEIGAVKANRYPRISLAGSVGLFSSRMLGNTNDGPSWSIGPSVYLPLFNGNRTEGQISAAQARMDEVLGGYKAKLAVAIRDTEEALVRIQSSAQRDTPAKETVKHYEAFLDASQARYKAGLGTLLELEEARRAVASANLNVLNVARDRAIAWISLYKALGGGFQTQDLLANLN